MCIAASCRSPISRDFERDGTRPCRSARSHPRRACGEDTVAPARRRDQGFLWRGFRWRDRRHARARRHRRLRAVGTRDYGALRHHTVADRSSSCAARPVPGVRAAGVRRRSDHRRCSRCRTLRATPRVRRRRARFRARRVAAERARRIAAFRRPGDEKRRRLRCLAPAVRLTRHPRADHAGFAEGAAAAARGNDVAIRLRRVRRARRSSTNLARATAANLGATAWHMGIASVRLSGSPSAVRSAREALGGETLDETRAEAWWRSLRDQTPPLFREGAASLWRLSLPATAPLDAAGGDLSRPSLASETLGLLPVELDRNGLAHCAGCAATRRLRKSAHRPNALAARQRCGMGEETARCFIRSPRPAWNCTVA